MQRAWQSICEWDLAEILPARELTVSELINVYFFPINFLKNNIFLLIIMQKGYWTVEFI